MAKSAYINMRVDPDLKRDTEEIFSSYGLKITDAINVFLHQARQVGGMPFDLRPPTPNSTTIAAMKEADRILEEGTGRRFSSTAEMFESLDDDMEE